MSSLPRRDWLAASGSLLLVKPATAFGSQANSKVNVGVIGTGNRGAYVANFFSKDPRVQVAALCDLYPDQIDAAKTHVPALSAAKSYKDYRDLLAQPGLDAIQITTPIYLHPEHFEAAVKAGKHIYCEKAAGASVGGVKRLIAAAKAAKPEQVIFFGFQQRLSPEYLKAEQIVHSPEFGELMLMRAEWMVGGADLKSNPRPKASPEKVERAWYPYRAKSGDFIVEQDCHGIDVLNWFAQAHPLSAIGGGNKGRRAEGDNLDCVSVAYYYPKNLLGMLQGTQLLRGWGNVWEQFFGEGGTITTHRKYYEWASAKAKPVRVDSKREITIDAVESFVSHIVEHKQKNMAFDAAESTLTAFLGRMAVDLRREVGWDEMLKSE